MNAWAAHIHGDRHDFREVDYRVPTCIVLGGEAEGIRPNVLAACKGSIYIRMADGWDCLNVAGSAAVLLSEVQRQRTTPGSGLSLFNTSQKQHNSGPREIKDLAQNAVKNERPDPGVEG